MRAATILRSVFLAGLMILSRAIPSPAQAPRQPDETPTFQFEMRGKPWASIFEWLTDKTGLPFVGDIPTGTFNVIVKAGQRYTLGELVDVLNSGLLPQKYLLIRNVNSFTVAPADQRLDKINVPRIRVSELPKRGHSEVVEIVLALESLSAEDYAPTVRKMLGVFGEVIPLKLGNRLILQDTAGNLRHILELTAEVDTALGKSELVPLVQVEAPRAAESLRAMFPDAKQGSLYIEGDFNRNAIFVKGTPGQIQQVKNSIRTMDALPDFGGMRTFTLPYGSGATMAELLERMLPRMLNSPVQVITPGGLTNKK